MVFIVALYVPWCGYLSAQHGVTPQLYADNLNCTDARFTDRYIGQLVRRLPLVSVCSLARPKLLGRR